MGFISYIAYFNGGGKYGVTILAGRGGSEGITLAFNTNLLKRSLNIIIGNTFSGNNTLTAIINNLKNT